MKVPGPALHPVKVSRPALHPMKLRAHLGDLLARSLHRVKRSVIHVLLGFTG
jgi:hypothetical protein